MRAEYDHKNNRVVSIQMDDGRVVSTHNPRILGAPTQWLDVEVQYPPGYDQRFNTLLRPQNVEYAYNKQGNKIIVTYPEADFSASAIRAELVNMVNIAARMQLERTDWYVVRKMETGKDIPHGKAEERQATRDKADALKAEIADLPDSDLVNFAFSFTTDTPAAKQAEPINTVEGGDGTPWVTDATSPDQEGKPVRQAAPHEVEDIEQQTQPFNPGATHGEVDEARPPTVPTGLGWSIDDSETR